MYVCATSSLPLAASFILAGIDIGAAFVFLTAGPATNIITINVVKDLLGKKVLIIYLLTIIIGSILFGLLLDYLFYSLEVKEILKVDKDNGIVASISSIILWTLVARILIKEKR